LENYVLQRHIAVGADHGLGKGSFVVDLMSANLRSRQQPHPAVAGAAARPP